MWRNMTSNIKTTCLLLIASMTLIPCYATVSTPAAATAKETPKPAMLSPQEQLATMLPSDEVTWLTTESGKFLALKRDYLAAKHRGVAIFVSDLSAPINYSLDIEPLRTSITQYGYSSITINAPSLDLFAPSTPKNEANEGVANSAESKTSEETASDTMIEATGLVEATELNATPYVQELVERINSAHKLGAMSSKEVILVIQGRQVAYLTNALIQQHLRPLRAVVVIDANVAMNENQATMYPATMKQLSQQLVQLKMPLFDIYHLWDTQIEEQMKLRKQLSIKAKQSRYRQHLKPTYSEEQTLSKVIYGWLKSLGIS
ncbi:alpha/beta hydrolase family protein [Psychrobium sp. MM17-31]|uniref:DUF3530 family protein n=1 Tax=Psychrobium sp. MM17-31 TaxID=2917758 RepID=UPI001EF4EF18|nr:DUF3530 family protein [Psychrobium sp. MM17-31]MCG7531227.1 alpha/beta hydrolase family protein [Psychrobium sp. MM17-31]